AHGGGVKSGACPPHHLRPNRRRSCLLMDWWSFSFLDLLCLSFSFGFDFVSTNTAWSHGGRDSDTTASPTSFGLVALSIRVVLVRVG
ncbi:hypothetical protein A2U01_0054957, partial [Trifolium medium]|nr:hypothetical protein [Trifolium medium]